MLYARQIPAFLMRRPPPLLYTDTLVSADMLYFGRVEVHDPFIAFGTPSTSLIEASLTNSL